jgi:microcystin-dependent protein
MKKLITLLFTLTLILVTNAYSQTDNKGFSFQGYAIDPDGKAMGGTAITVRFTIYPQGGSPEYTEETNLTSDAFGVFVTTIGSQAINDFAKINFAIQVYNLKVEVKKTSGGVYSTISDGQLLSVPYARSASNGVPVGSIIPFGGPLSSVPAGWLPCDGTQLNRTNYTQLYNVIGYSWGGNGDVFNIPDLRGYFLRGVADVQTTDPDKDARGAIKSGGNTGNNVGSYQDEMFKSHNHNPDSNYPNSTGINDVDHTHTYNDIYYSENRGPQGDLGWRGSNSSDDDNGPWSITETSAGESQPHRHQIVPSGGSETRPKNAYVWFIIKY